MAAKKPYSVASVKAVTIDSISKFNSKRRKFENALAKNVGLTDEDIQVINAIDEMVELED